MIARFPRRLMATFTVLATWLLASHANAWCCGGGATTAYYPGTYNTYYAGSYSAYRPTTAYYPTTASTGWYPGYFLDRIRARLWGTPTTYAAAYPTTAYYAGYAPTYSASYATPMASSPSYSTSYATSASYGTSYAAPSGCSSCSTYTTSYAPSTCSTCTTVCAPVCPCDSGGGSTYAASGVTQATYQQPACPSCSTGTVQQSSQTVTQQQPLQQQPRPEVAQPQTFGTNNQPPTIDPEAEVPLERQQQRPIETENDEVPIQTQPSPGGETNGLDPYGTGDSATFVPPPQLFDPNDRTAKRHIAPVTTAVYKKPVSYRTISSRPVTAEQAKQDAIGWSSASK